jgi:hypothetical protein
MEIGAHGSESHSDADYLSRMVRDCGPGTRPNTHGISDLSTRRLVEASLKAVAETR